MKAIAFFCLAATTIAIAGAARASDEKGGGRNPPALPAHPALHFSFEKPPENNRVLDTSGKANHAMNHGAAWIPDGRIGGAMRFDGKSSWLQLPAARIMRTARFTFAAWIRPAHDLRGSRRCAIISRERKGKTAGFDFAWHDGRLGLAFSVEPSLRPHCTAADANRSLAAGVWRFAAATYDGDIARIYLDGEPLTTIPITLDWSDGASREIFFGAQAPGDQGFWPGDMDEIMIFEQALTPEDIKTLAIEASQQQPPTTNHPFETRQHD